MNSLLVAQLIGLVATAFSAGSVLMRCDRRLRLVAATGQSIWALHFLMLGAPTAAATSALTCSRQLSSVAAARLPSAGQWALTILFYVAFTAATALTWEGWVSLLPWACATLANYAYSSLTGVSMRKALRGCDGIAIANGCVVGSIGALLTATLSITLNTLTIRKLEGRKTIDVTSVAASVRAFLRRPIFAR